VILVTDCVVCYGQAWRGMIQRSIASGVLATLCWLSLPFAFGSTQMPTAQRFQRTPLTITPAARDLTP
jgi:hypothetical protein